MQRFFKLQKVLDYRNLILEKEKAQMAVLVQQEKVIEDEIRSVTAEMHEKQQEMTLSAEENDFYFTGMYSKYIKTLEAKRLQAQKVLANHRQVMHQQKGQTVAAYRRKSIMDKLKTKHKTAYTKFVDTQEAKTVEDIVLTRKASEINSDGDK